MTRRSTKASAQAQLAAARLAAQRLAGRPAATPEEAVGRILAVQAQDPRGARLAVRSRSTGLTVADVDDAFTMRRSLVVSWLNRGTLHLVTAADYWLLHPLTTPQLRTNNARRLREEGVDEKQAQRGVEVVAEAVESDGPQTRAGLRERLDAAGVPNAGQALVHVLLAASIEGHIVRGPMVDGEQAFVSVRRWLGPPPEPLERGEALGVLARRYLAGHAPATPNDLAKWAGITLGDARRGFRAIADELVPWHGADAAGGAAGRDGVDGLHTLASDEGSDTDEAAHAMPEPRLLGAFDPILHGWASRALFVGDHQNVVTKNGIFRPVALVEGRVVATWSMPDGVVTIAPLERIAPRTRAALAADAAAVQRFLKLPERGAQFT